MNLQYYYWYFDNVLSNKFCDRVINEALERQKLLGITHEEEKVSKRRKVKKNLTKKDLSKLKQVRDSSIVWMNDKFIYDTINPFIHKANENAQWNYDLSWAESCQFTIYEKGGHYGWHCDSYMKPYDKPSEPNFHGKVRKLSVTVSLSDPKNYKGGELEFDFRNNNNGKPARRVVKEIKKRGSIVVFPSYLWHRVKPVTSGTRYSLVIWNIGAPFK